MGTFPIKVRILWKTPLGYALSVQSHFLMLTCVYVNSQTSKVCVRFLMEGKKLNYKNRSFFLTLLVLLFPANPFKRRCRSTPPPPPSQEKPAEPAQLQVLHSVQCHHEGCLLERTRLETRNSFSCSTVRRCGWQYPFLPNFGPNQHLGAGAVPQQRLASFIALKNN